MREKSFADDVISRLLKAYGIPSDRGSLTKLSEILGTSPSVVSGWRARGVPERIISRAMIDTGCLEKWLIFGEGEMRAGMKVSGHSDPAVQALVEDELGTTETTLTLTGQEARLIKMFRGCTPDRKQLIYDLVTEAYISSKEENNG